MRKLYLLTFLFSITSLILSAQNRLAGNMFLKKLLNGLEVLVVEDNSVPLATVMMTFKGGAITETDTTNGLNALYTNMLLGGNKEYQDQQDLHYHAGQLGMQLLNSVTTAESSKFFFTLPKANVEQGLNFMNSAVRFAKMDPDEMENEKRTIQQALRERESSPFSAFYAVLYQHLWGDMYSRKNAVPTLQVIRAATAASMNAVRSRYFNPDNALLIVDGSVEHENVFNLVQKIYGDWKPGNFDPFKKWPIPEVKPLSKTDYFTVESPLSKSPVIEIMWQGPDTRNDIPSTYAADVFSYLLNQSTSKLYQALVQSGLALSISFNYLTLKHVGPISLTITPNPLKINECMEEVNKQIALMDNDEYLSARQIQIGKRMLEITGIRESENTMSHVSSLSFWWASASLNYYNGYYDNLNKVTADDVKNYVRKYIKGRPYCAGLLINPEQSTSLRSGLFFKPHN